MARAMNSFKKEIIVSAFLFFCLINSSNAQWIQTICPSGIGKAVLSICIKDSSMFIGTDDGIFLSKNNGINWTDITPVLPPAYYSPNKDYPNVVINGNDIITVNGVIITSHDDGKSWDVKYYSNVEYPSIAIANGQNLLAGGGGNIYHSSDYGISWAKKDSTNGVISFFNIDSLYLAGTSNYRILLSTNSGRKWKTVYSKLYCNSFAVLGTKIIAAGDSSILSSSDRGQNWKLESKIHGCRWINSVFPVKGTGFIFAGTDSGVFRSSDNGIKWTAVNNGIPIKIIFSFAYKDVGTGGTPILFAATVGGLYQSTDYGENWKACGPMSLSFLASSNSELYAGTTNELFFSTTLSKYSIQTSAIKRCFIYRTTDDGSTWTKADNGFPQPKNDLDRKQGNTLTSLVVRQNSQSGFNAFAAAGNGTYCSIYASSDNGSSWVKTFPSTTYNSDAYTLAINNAGVYAGSLYSGDFYRSSDFGNNWSKVDSGMTFRVYGNYYGKVPIYAFTIDDNKIYEGGTSDILGTRSNQLKITCILVSEDNGVSWDKVKSNFNDSVSISGQPAYSTLSCLYAKGDHLLIGMKIYPSDSHYTSNIGGVFHLIKNGSEWVVKDSSFIGQQIISMAGNNSDVFLATETGIYYSSDYGSNWKDISSGLQNPSVTALVIKNSYLFASTTNGVWKRPLFEIISDVKVQSKELPTKFSLDQNYPNPFNPTTVISYQLPESSHVKLIVYDILGREVAVLVNNYQHSGNYSVEFNASKLSSGIYIYTIHANEFLQSKKMIVLK